LTVRVLKAGAALVLEVHAKKRSVRETPASAWMHLFDGMGLGTAQEPEHVAD
jgi:hypothetical protein